MHTEPPLGRAPVCAPRPANVSRKGTPILSDSMPVCTGVQGGPKMVCVGFCMRRGTNNRSEGTMHTGTEAGVVACAAFSWASAIQVV